VQQPNSVLFLTAIWKKVSWRSTFSIRSITKYFFVQCHLQSAISCWCLHFPNICRPRNTQVWINLA